MIFRSGEVSKLYQIVLLCLLLLPNLSLASGFDDAQVAAQEGRYRDVVELLSKELESENLNKEDQLVAYSNRGIAYSLLKAFGLADKDLQKAIELDSNHKLTLNHLGLISVEVRRDYESAASYFQRAVDQDFAASQVNLGNLYLKGLGVKENTRKAFELYGLAAEQGYSLAYVPLGLMYANGQTAERNSKKAFELFTKASDAGIAVAHYHMAKALEYGRGVKQDAVLAASNYRIAAMQGHAEAQNALGYMYRRGSGVKQNFVEAALWYELASEQGVAQAKNRLSWLLAGCPVERVCNGELAVQVALEAVALNKDPGFLDSLAAAYARTGQFDLAIKTLEKALLELPEDSRQRRSFEKRLTSYNLGIPLQL